jgi:hypothetical protein
LDSSNQEQCDHTPLFAHQHVEGAAGGTGIHHLEADARLQEACTESGARENLPLAGAEEHEFGIELQHVGGVFRRQIGDRPQLRLGPHRRGGDDHGGVRGVAIDPQFRFAVAADDIHIRIQVLSEAHGGKIRNLVPVRLVLPRGCDGRFCKIRRLSDVPSVSEAPARRGAPTNSLYIRFPVHRAESWARAPVLERLLVRAVLSAQGSDWRGEAFRAIAASDVPRPPTASAALLAAAEPAPGAWVCVATPVHLVAGMTNVTLSNGGILALDPAQAQALAADFNQVFGASGVRLVEGRDAVLLCVFDRVLEVTTHDPEDVVGGDVFAFQPTGPDAMRVRRLLSEIEMWLFEHAINRARTARELPAITGLWFWGGGEPLPALPGVTGWTAGRDPLFSAFGTVPAFPAGGGAGVVVCAEAVGSADWRDAESRWLVPALASLRSGAIRRLELSAGRQHFSITGRRAWRFWRRPRPWWESFEVEGVEANGIQ